VQHYILNEQEKNRESINSVAGDRVLHELYLWPFADAVNANVASVMCSYNQINGSYACEDDYILNTILKDELGFPGYVVSDWNAQKTTAASANAGLDMSMPGDDFSKDPSKIYWGSKLQSAVSSGQVSQDRLNDMVERILAAWYYVGQDSNFPSETFSAWNGGSGGPNVQDDHKTTARAIARDGIVLLKNEDNILPLNKPSSLAIIGSGKFCVIDA
jgi:beta-glucosidase